MPFLTSLAEHSVVVKSPGTKHEIFPFPTEMLALPSSDGRGKAAAGAGGRQSRAGWVLDPADLTLSEDQLAENDYPGFARAGIVPRYRRKELVPVEGALPLPPFVATRPRAAGAGAGAAAPRLFAMDCEMCSTCLGLELARVSLVGVDRAVVLDMLVLPTNPVLDYNTQFSGITAEILADVTATVDPPPPPRPPPFPPSPTLPVPLASPHPTRPGGRGDAAEGGREGERGEEGRKLVLVRLQALRQPPPPISFSSTNTPFVVT